MFVQRVILIAAYTYAIVSGARSERV